VNKPGETAIFPRASAGDGGRIDVVDKAPVVHERPE
jgi:hypothetical protein